jgi:CheY-like chemotaxis protein
VRSLQERTRIHPHPDHPVAVKPHYCPSSGSHERLVSIMNTPSTPSNQQRRNVLVVEDHTDTARMISMVLEDEGYRVTLANDAQSAFQILTSTCDVTRTCPDVVLMDLTMPGTDPLTMIRDLGARPIPPVILLSAKPDKALAAAAEQIGAAAVVHKPFNIDELIASVRQILT